MKRVAVIDVGTNSALLVVAGRSSSGSFVEVASMSRAIRLGEGVDESGVISKEAVDRLVAVLGEYKSVAQGVDAVRVVATSASRDATNIGEVVDAVKRRTGLAYSVISGHDEARYSFRGALLGVRDRVGGDRRPVVVDIGGGSTELTVGTDDGRGDQINTSIDIGSVRLFERYISSQPPAASDVVALRDAVRSAFVSDSVTAQLVQDGSNDADGIRQDIRVIGAAGTALALAHLHAVRHGREPRVDDPRPYTEELDQKSLDELTAFLLDRSKDEILGLSPEIMTGRADIVVVGAIILDELAKLLGAPNVTISPYALRHGVAMEMLEL